MPTPYIKPNTDDTIRIAPDDLKSHKVLIMFMGSYIESACEFYMRPSGKCVLEFSNPKGTYFVIDDIEMFDILFSKENKPIDLSEFDYDWITLFASDTINIHGEHKDKLADGTQISVRVLVPRS